MNIILCDVFGGGTTSFPPSQHTLPCEVGVAMLGVDMEPQGLGMCCTVCTAVGALGRRSGVWGRQTSSVKWGVKLLLSASQERL